MTDTYLNNIFQLQHQDFENAAIALFQQQYKTNKVYHAWVDALKQTTHYSPTQLIDIPFLPISFFKTHSVKSGDFESEIVFESSGTTGMTSSKHYVDSLEWYTKSFTTAFNLFYGDVKEYCIIGLLPSYLERKGSSLVKMVDELILQSKHPQSGFYLNELERLMQVLQQLKAQEQPVLLIGVTFGLLELATLFPENLGNQTIIMETGGMKGRRKEMTREEVHQILQQAFGTETIHSEYGMTELLSQAYSKGNGRFYCPPWMKVMVRSTDDPLALQEHGKGVLNIIDLANKCSCSFIATDDIGVVYEDGSFEVQGRIDNSDLRGCNLLVV
jgi:hypothetical protein